MNTPAFTAEASLYRSASTYERYFDDLAMTYKEAVISPAYRVVCGSSIALGLTCTMLGFLSPYAMRWAGLDGDFRV